MGGYNIGNILPKNQHTQRKLLNFENWCNGEVSKIGHRFRSGLKIDIIKSCAPKLIFYNEKKMRKIPMTLDIEN